jgi:peptidoglycan/LPS O-acetylase OafA/YrhL
LSFFVFSFTSGIVILHAAFEDSKILNKILSNRVLKYLGKISYGLYLYHYPIFYSTEYLKIKLDPQNIYQAMLIDVVRIAIALVISILSYEFFEKRILKLRTKFEA